MHCHVNIDNRQIKYDNDGMDLSFLIPSKVRRLVLAYWVKNPDAQMHVRGLARELNLSPQQTYKELINMENWGLLFSSASGNQREYRLNKRFKLFSGLKEIFENYEKFSNPEVTIVNEYNWNDLAKDYRKLKINPQMTEKLTAKRTIPRAYAEEKLMKKKGLL